LAISCSTGQPGSFGQSARNGQQVDTVYANLPQANGATHGGLPAPGPLAPQGSYVPPGSVSFPSTSGFLGSAGAISSPWAGGDQRRSTVPTGQTASFYAARQKKETNVLLCASF